MRRALFTLSVGIYLGLAAFAWFQVKQPQVALAQEDDAPMAPELEDGLGWINVDHPLRLADLRGQLVVLDFWTYG